MADDTEFEPRLGRQRVQGGKPARRYLSRVLAAAALARSGAPAGGRSAGFSGSRIGRGAGVGRVLAARGPHAALRQRRVIVKASIVRLAGKGADAAAAHLRYLQRDGTTREGDRGALYGAETDGADGAAFRARGTGDRHQFRFIVSPEDGAEYDDLKSLTRRLMTQVEDDLGTRLDWVAIDHFNTGHPHTHIVVRGVDERGADLVIAREYLTQAIRERAAELVDLDLGPRTARAIETALRAEVEQDRLTSIDRDLLRGAEADGIVEARGATAFEQTIRAGRLAKLQRMGLAERVGSHRFRLADNLADTLRRMGERCDIVRTLQRALTDAAVDRAGVDQNVYDPSAEGARRLVGRLVARGLADEHADRHYLVVDAVDGRSHYVAIGRGLNLESVPAGAIVAIEPVRATVRAADRTIAEVAVANGGVYDIDAHLRHDPGATEDFAQTHVRRLEAMRRGGGGVERTPSGQWMIAADHLDRVEAWERTRLADRPVAVAILSRAPLDRLVDAHAVTWLDREAVSAAPEPLRDAGFGRDVRLAQERRRLWLVEQDLAEAAGDQRRYRPGALETLRRRELMTAADRLSSEIGLPFADPGDDPRVSGIYRRSIDLASGRYALIERRWDFTLVPWRPVLEPHAGKAVSGIVRGDGISWTIGRGRSGPSIT
ncbi:relaxase/mobilization nuclease RlxS [Sphingomonas sp. 1P08PE]|uniref:relaxase/mobilization nuclease RlxS n=1 Tax=Sphingomonas sp. 1P08PE TaxID=554122 RepID=UPI0039A22293